MKLIYKGKFNGDVDSIPHGEHKPGAVKFKEPEDPKKLGILANGIAIAIIFITLAGVIFRSGIKSFGFTGVFLSYLTLIPHEILHAICFKDEVYFYTNFKNGVIVNQDRFLALEEEYPEYAQEFRTIYEYGNFGCR